MRPRRRKDGLWAESHPASAFTLLETLVSLSVIALMVTLLLPALKSVRDEAKSLECCSNMRGIAFDFRLFVEGDIAGGRGDSELLGQNRFWIDDFQERLYGLDEFWEDPEQLTIELTGADTSMICPAGLSPLTKRQGFPCSSEALGPPENTSLAFNMRLRRATTQFMGKSVLAPAASSHLSTRIIDHPSVPLVLDVDGGEAAVRHVEPFYTAPAVQGQVDPYASGTYWMPSRRHRGQSWVAFVGGYVLSSDQPETEFWDWSYQAELGH